MSSANESKGVPIEDIMRVLSRHPISEIEVPVIAHIDQVVLQQFNDRSWRIANYGKLLTTGGLSIFCLLAAAGALEPLKTEQLVDKYGMLVAATAIYFKSKPGLNAFPDWSLVSWKQVVDLHRRANQIGKALFVAEPKKMEKQEGEECVLTTEPGEQPEFWGVYQLKWDQQGGVYLHEWVRDFDNEEEAHQYATELCLNHYYFIEVCHSSEAGDKAKTLFCTTVGDQDLAIALAMNHAYEYATDPYVSRCEPIPIKVFDVLKHYIKRLKSNQ